VSVASGAPAPSRGDGNNPRAQSMPSLPMPAFYPISARSNREQEAFDPSAGAV